MTPTRTPSRPAGAVLVALLAIVGAMALRGSGPTLLADDPPADEGRSLYRALCASCHHDDRVGRTASPLLPEFLGRSSDAKLARVIKDGLPATAMPSFPGLTEAQRAALVRYLRTPGEVRWTQQSIAASRELEQGGVARPAKVDRRALTAVVERGNSQVWLIEGLRVLDSFRFDNVHGGIKFNDDVSKLYVPARDGWIGCYDIARGRYHGRVRAGVYLRNICLSRDGKRLFGACWLPRSLAVLDARTLAPERVLPLKGKVSAIYELTTRNECVFTYRDRPELGILDTRTLEVRHVKLPTPLDDFFIDPLDRFVIGTSRAGKTLSVHEIATGKQVFSHPIEGLPHLFSAAVWYRDGRFHFATTHIGKPLLTIWTLYDWGFVKALPLGGQGYFVRTHRASPYLWVDNGSDAMVLVDKSDLSLRKHQVRPGKRVLHTEFSGDGTLAYLSILDAQGAIEVLDSTTLAPRGRLAANRPMGKYNVLNKGRRYEAPALGAEVYQRACWGCHHPTKTAFAPSLRWIARNRDEGAIRAQIVAPGATSKHLGYMRSAMPRVGISPQELDVLVRYIREIGLGTYD